MEPGYTPPKESPRRKIVIENDAFGFGNFEAWFNIIRSYQELHPRHQVLLYYRGEHVQSTTYLFKLGKQLDPTAFEVSVAAPDEDFTHVKKLYRLLVEGAGTDYRKFLIPELHRTLKLF